MEDVRQMKSKVRELNTYVLDEKSIATCIILSIVTCGIYSIYWMYTMIKKVAIINRENDVLAQFLLCMFIPFYGYYWAYTRGNKFGTAAREYGITDMNDRGILYLLLNVFIAIVFYGILQDDLNKCARRFREVSSLPEPVEPIDPFAPNASANQDSSATASATNNASAFAPVTPAHSETPKQNWDSPTPPAPEPEPAPKATNSQPVSETEKFAQLEKLKNLYTIRAFSPWKNSRRKRERF